MSLFGEENILHSYTREEKKSIHPKNNIDKFLIIALFILIAGPVFFKFIFRARAEASPVNLYISPNCVEFFGGEITKKLFRDFEELNPGIRIKEPQDDALPDILIFDDGGYSAYAAMGALENLNNFGEDEFHAPRLAVPLVSFMDVLFYNIDLLTAAGFDRPPKTREDYIVSARAFAGARFSGAGISGAALSLSRNDPQALSRDIFSWIWASGGDFWAGENVPALSARATNADLLFFAALNRDGMLAPGVFSTTGERRLEEFAQGKVAMMIASTRVIPFLRERMGDDAFGITTIPVSGTGGRYRIVLSSIYAGLNTGSAHPEEAWNFLVFLAEQSPLFCAELKAVPGLFLDVIPGDYIRDDPFYSKAQDIFESSGIVEGFAGKADAAEYETVFLEEFRRFFEAGRTAQETIAAIQRRWAEIE
jgi:ABC-type glycerol-3-phosphate transport system substrate-binding protein